MALAGRGGMGEVYRADDLKLGHPVALKFMPPEVSADPVRLEAFLNEVRLTRQISHPNVCRVYDIAEHDGQPFISMEYIDGGDLQGLLRRIGRLPGDRGAEIARQLCSGLAAAHDKGVLHRDLKPANIMIDDGGRVRIMDFGLARLSSDEASAAQVVGTMNYMAPEQLARGESTIQSDLYSLGLILHELFTGEAVHQCRTVKELRAAHEHSTPARPSDVVSDIDPAVDRVIGHCLEKDARMRPRSAHVVATALPGADPLAAALAAGETPSPDMVAAAGTQGLLPTHLGAALLALLMICLIGYPFQSDARNFIAKTTLPKKPEVLEAEAQDVIRELGYEVEGQDHVFEIEIDLAYLRHLGQERAGPDRWEPLESEPPALFHFWFRQSPRTIRSTLEGVVLSRVTRYYPPLGAGMIELELDMQGRLVSFVARPGRFESPAPPGEAEPAWDDLFERAGLDRARFRPPEEPVDPVWNAPVPCDQRRTWTGTLSDENPLAIRVEAGSLRGRVAAFGVMAPWNIERPAEDRIPQGISLVDDASTTSLLLITGLLAVMGVRNARRGRGDRRGSFRIGLAIVLGHMAYWLLDRSRLPEVIDGFLSAFGLALAISLYWGVLGWLFYMALEPYLRRRCPHRIISWSRLLAGRWKDPLVGRDLLVGLAAGSALAVGGSVLVDVLRSALDLPGAVGAARSLPLGLRHTVAGLVLSGFDGAVVALMAACTPLVVQFVVRKLWIAVAILWVLASLFSSLGLWNFDTLENWILLAAIVGGIRAAVFLNLLLRVGLLATSACLFVSLCLWTTGTSSFGEWHGQPTLITMLVIGGLGTLGFFHSLAGRRVFRDALDG